MKKTVVLLISFALAAVCSALPEVNPQKAWRPQKAAVSKKAVSVRPVIQNENAIICGNKKLTLSKDGRLVISNISGEIATVNFYYVFQDSAGKVDWFSETPALCKVRRDGNKIIWELWKQHRLETWKVADQTLELLPDGLLKLEVQTHNPKTTKLTPRSSAAAIFITFPVAGNEGKTLVSNGNKLKLAAGMKGVSLWRGNRFDYDLFPENPAESVSLKNVSAKATTKIIVGKRHRIAYTFDKSNKGAILIDLRKSSDEKSDSANIGAGIDFKHIENVELPWRGKRNLLANSGFEQDFFSWKSHTGFYSAYWDGKWEFVPFEISKDSFHGKNSLLMHGRKSDQPQDFRSLRGGINLTSGALLLAPGKYTMSFYAKAVSGSARLNVWIHNFHTRNATHYVPPHDSGSITVWPGKKWKRYSKVVIIEKASPTALSVNVNGPADILIDAIQFEAGEKATEYEFPPATGTLLTSDPDNFISSSAKVDASVRIFAKPDMKGKVTARVKNFFGEIVKRSTSDFQTDSEGLATVKLPFENLGKGLFMVRFDYELADGSKSFDHTRFTVLDFLNNTHRHKNMFSDDYGHMETHYLFYKLLDRWRKTGIGAKTHMSSRDPMFWNKYREYGIELFGSSMATVLWGPNTTKVKGFGITDHVPPGPRYTTDTRFLVKDHCLDNNGEIDDAYFKRVEEAAEKAARAHKHIKCWTLAGEIRAKFPNEWWHKSGTDAMASEVHARYLKAVVDGVHRGNPEAQVYQDDPCNMRPDGGIAETAKLLEVCNRLGVKFDVLAIHPYRFSPESPDIDADAVSFFKAVKKQGYGDDVKVMWLELMHWGPLNIPQWGTDSSTWGVSPRTWPGWTLSYDIAETEKRSATWRARTWLVALKYADRIPTATSGSDRNNFCFDEYFTPYASQLMSNTLGNILGDSTFKKDIRFAPFVRAYVFEDAEKRPVAAVWCHMENVDNGYVDAPVAEADFGGSLESVIDLMNNKRAFTRGKFQFPVTSYPLFLRGKKGTLKQMVKALENAVVVSGEGISPVEASANPIDSKSVKVTLKNCLSSEFKGTFNGKRVVIPGSGQTEVVLPLTRKITKNTIVKVPLKGVLKSDKGQTYNYDLDFNAFSVGKVADDVTLDTVEWSKLPAVKFPGNSRKKETTGDFRVGWNQFGLFVQVQVRDKKFVHIEYPRIADRWKNDCLQIYFDTMANARRRQFKGYDEDDYDYAVYPNSKGDSSIVFRQRSVEQQLGLATQAPPDMTVAGDIPSSFSSKNGVLTYRVFFPAKYLLPARMNAGWVMGLGLYAANSDVPEKVSSALTVASDNGGCYNTPHTYPAMLLAE